MKKQPVIAHLREHFIPCIPGIFSWLIFFLQRNPARYLVGTATTSSHGVLHACHILDCALLLEDEDISYAIRTSHEVAELMVTIWLTKNRDLEYADPTLELRHPNEYVVYPVDELGRCPVTSMLSLIMANPTSRATFIHVWCNSLQVKARGRDAYDPVTLMTRTILSRLYQIEVSILEARCKPHSSWGALKPLLDILQAFLDSSLPLPSSTASRTRYAPPTPLEKQFKIALLASLRKERFILQFTHVLHILSDYGLADERTRNFQYAPQTFIAVPLDVLRFYTSILLQPFFSSSAGLLTHFAEMVQGGLLQISANCAIVLKNYKSYELLSLERGTFYGQLASELPRMCHTMAIFPPVLKAMARVFERPAGDEKGVSEEQREALNWAVERYDGLTTKSDGTRSGYAFPWFDEIIKVVKEWMESIARFDIIRLNSSRIRWVVG
ncbi:hypothetical protein BKA70DRAFT_680649 [Coprinopsis sp. MPI-PUGE-AT-0042]|nr:hypothetical protein BKA70DRAFT_680649 [Coprinopsis sp. MPI-PUGE-AT-0042]